LLGTYERKVSLATKLNSRVQAEKAQILLQAKRSFLLLGAKSPVPDKPAPTEAFSPMLSRLLDHILWHALYQAC